MRRDKREVLLVLRMRLMISSEVDAPGFYIFLLAMKGSKNWEQSMQ